MTQNYIHTLYNVGFLILALYYSYIRCNHWVNLGEGYMGPQCTTFTTSYESIIMYKWKVTKIHFIFFLSRSSSWLFFISTFTLVFFVCFYKHHFFFQYLIILTSQIVCVCFYFLLVFLVFTHSALFLIYLWFSTLEMFIFFETLYLLTLKSLDWNWVLPEPISVCFCSLLEVVSNQNYIRFNFPLQVFGPCKYYEFDL